MTTTTTDEARVRAAATREGLRLQRRRQPKGSHGPTRYRVFGEHDRQVFGGDGVELSVVMAYLTRLSAPTLEDLPPLDVLAYRDDVELIAVGTRWASAQADSGDETRALLRTLLAEWSDWSRADLDRAVGSILAAVETERVDD